MTISLYQLKSDYGFSGYQYSDQQNPIIIHCWLYCTSLPQQNIHYDSLFILFILFYLFYSCVLLLPQFPLPIYCNCSTSLYYFTVVFLFIFFVVDMVQCSFRMFALPSCWQGMPLFVGHRQILSSTQHNSSMTWSIIAGHFINSSIIGIG